MKMLSTGCLKSGDTAGRKGEQQSRQTKEYKTWDPQRGRKLPPVENSCRSVLPLN
ncbi:MAG: hypothetical protein J6C32_00325 [Eubacterium sp.]|nr:hypothetical protein [Eubacterium sp.]